MIRHIIPIVLLGLVLRSQNAPIPAVIGLTHNETTLIGALQNTVAGNLSDFFFDDVDEYEYELEDTDDEDTDTGLHGSDEVDVHVKKLGKEPKSPSGHCRLLINEVNINNSGSDNKAEFIEFLKSCTTPRKGRKRSRLLTGFKVIIISGSDPHLLFVADLKDLDMDDRQAGRFFVIGTPNVPNVDLSTSPGNDAVKNFYENEANLNVFPKGDIQPFAIVLLYAQSPKDLRPIDLHREEGTNKYMPRKIDNHLLKIISDFAQDMVVYARRAHTDRCNIFEHIFPEPLLNPERYILRDWDSPQVDMSLNRCGPIVEPFKTDSFKFGNPTPGDANDCSGTIVHIEDIIDSVAIPVHMDQDDSVAACKSSDISPTRFELVDEDKYHEVVATEQARVSSSNVAGLPLDANIAEVGNEVIRHNELVEGMGSSPRVPEYADVSHFDPNWILEILQFQSNLIDTELIQRSDVKPWFVKYNTVDLSFARFGCRWCRDFFAAGNRLDVRRKKNIQTPHGVLMSSKKENSRQISLHLGNECHLAAQRQLYDIAAKRSHNDFENIKAAYEGTDSGYYIPTVNVFKAVYAETLANVPFFRHGLIVALLKGYGVPVGKYHNTDVSAKLIMQAISQGMHEILLHSLVDKKQPFSLLIDGTTDKSNIPYLITYIQTIENAKSIVYFYRLIEIKGGESGDSVFKSFIAAVKSDSTPTVDFENYFRIYIKALVTDGASNNIGPKNSFLVSLNTFLGREVYSVHCMAHRLDLSIKWAVRGDPRLTYFANFDQSISKLYRFYMSRGSKRWQHLTEMAEDLELPLLRLKHWFNVRWSSSHYGAMKAVTVDYEALRADLTAISADTTFSVNARASAVELENIFSDKTFTLAMYSYMDFLGVFAGTSTTLQTKTGLLSGTLNVINAAKDELLEIKGLKGRFVKEFLIHITCPDICTPPSCTIEQYEACPLPDYKNQLLKDNDPTSVKVSTIYDVLIESLVLQIDRYFPQNALVAFDIFVPEKFPMQKKSESNTPKVESVNSTFGIEQIAQVCTILRWSEDDCTLAQADFPALIQSVLISSSWPVKMYANPDIFWFSILDDVTISWTPVLKKLIREALVIPYGTAECERGFSYLTKTRGVNRADLKPESMDNILRIKINGPTEPQVVNILRYVREWLKHHCRSDADKCLGGRPKKKFTKRSPKIARSTLF